MIRYDHYVKRVNECNDLGVLGNHDYIMYIYIYTMWNMPGEVIKHLLIIVVINLKTCSTRTSVAWFRNKNRKTM